MRTLRASIEDLCHRFGPRQDLSSAPLSLSLAQDRERSSGILRFTKLKGLMMCWPHGLLLTALCATAGSRMGLAQSGHPDPPAPPPGAKTKKCSGRPIPQFTDVTAQAGINFKHTSDP